MPIIVKTVCHYRLLFVLQTSSLVLVGNVCVRVLVSNCWSTNWMAKQMIAQSNHNYNNNENTQCDWSVAVKQKSKIKKKKKVKKTFFSQIRLPRRQSGIFPSAFNTLFAGAATLPNFLPHFIFINQHLAQSNTTTSLRPTSWWWWWRWWRELKTNVVCFTVFFVVWCFQATQSYPHSLNRNSFFSLPL